MAQEKSPTLPYPKVEYATDENLLYPLHAKDGTKVTVAFEGMSNGHRIQPYWDGPSGAGTPTLPVVDGSDSGSVEFPIDASVIGACVGKTVHVWYTGTLDNVEEESFPLELTIESIKPEDLPVSKFCDLIEHNGDEWLDMRTFPGNARVAMPKWPFIAAGQRLWILAVGNEHLIGNYRFSWVLENHVVTTQEAESEGEFELKLLRTWLAGCEDYSSVTLNVAVTFDGEPGNRPVNPLVSLLPENAHELPHTTAKLRVTEIEEFDDFESYPKKEYLGPGSIIDTRLLKFELPRDSPKGIGLHVVRTPPENFPEMLQGKALALCCGGLPEQLRRARLLLKWKCSRIKFAYATTGEGATFRFIGDGDLLLEERWVESRTWVDFQDLQGRLLYCIEVESLQHGSIDNLTIWHKGESNPV